MILDIEPSPTGRMPHTDPATRLGIDRELLERIAALETEVQQLRAQQERIVEPDRLFNQGLVTG